MKRFFKVNKKTGERIHDFKREQRINKLTTTFKNNLLHNWLEI